MSNRSVLLHFPDRFLHFPGSPQDTTTTHPIRPLSGRESELSVHGGRIQDMKSPTVTPFSGHLGFSGLLNLREYWVPEPRDLTGRPTGPRVTDPDTSGGDDRQENSYLYVPSTLVEVRA